MTIKAKARLFFGIAIAMVGYIGWSFYISEPKYENNANSRKLQAYDWVSLPSHSYSWDNKANMTVENGLVLQIDSEKALVKINDRHSWDNMKELDIAAHQYRIIGRGTIYHKINHWVGFNIMIVSQFFIGALLVIIVMTQAKLLNEIL